MNTWQGFCRACDDFRPHAHEGETPNPPPRHPPSSKPWLWERLTSYPTLLRCRPLPFAPVPSKLPGVVQGRVHGRDQRPWRRGKEFSEVAGGEKGFNVYIEVSPPLPATGPLLRVIDARALCIHADGSETVVTSRVRFDIFCCQSG